MNIAFFLLPKSEVVHLNYKCTMRQALEKMEFHRYSAIPLINDDGKYAGTLTEGDLLWKLKNTPHLDFEHTNHVRIEEIPLHLQNKAISINEEMEAIISRAMEQNFVPVVDDKGIFIGIIRRREIIEYCARNFLIKNN
ncbi:CBS domain-containing protein [Bacillus sp. UNC41MFS5]|uniref:CBS domain-containing protein n=1 Tax=Bacillus sp. UNC41MFS5 TaxID=1449046 RepID=UPI000479AE75|nr:CBS domain-containing protein [Bacillus sp. UNC41MFS5]